jgi:hypothetical protein
MTIHDQFRRRRLKALTAIPVCFILFAASGELYKRYHSPTFLILGIIAFIGFAASGIVLGFAFRCPQCHKLVMSVNTPGESILSFPNFCQNCGLDLRLVEKESHDI